MLIKKSKPKRSRSVCWIVILLISVSTIQANNKEEQPRQPYWKTKLHLYYFIQPVNVEWLFPWLEEYQKAGEEFHKRNHVAFRFAMGVDSVGWWYKLALAAADPEIGKRHHDALVHLASAMYTRIEGPQGARAGLRSPDPEIARGTLKLLVSTRALTRKDTRWPKDRLLDPKVLPSRIAIVLKQHPDLATYVVKALVGYGTQARKEARELVPLLLSNRFKVDKTIQAIKKMDPDGLAKSLRLQNCPPLTVTQLTRIRSLMSHPVAEDHRESDGSPESEQSRKLRRLLTCYRKWSGLEFDEDKQLVSDFLDRELSDEQKLVGWWKLVGALTASRIGTALVRTKFVDLFATLLYARTGSPEVALRLLNDGDIRTSGETAIILARIWDLPKTTEYYSGFRVEPKTMPRRLVSVLKRHPLLINEIANAMARYEPDSRKESAKLVPFLLSENPGTVWSVRIALIQIDPKGIVAQLRLEMEFEPYIYEDSAKIDQRQVEMIKKFIKRSDRD